MNILDNETRKNVDRVCKIKSQIENKENLKFLNQICTFYLLADSVVCRNKKIHIANQSYDSRYLKYLLFCLIFSCVLSGTLALIGILLNTGDDIREVFYVTSVVSLLSINIVGTCSFAISHINCSLEKQVKINDANNSYNNYSNILNSDIYSKILINNDTENFLSQSNFLNISELKNKYFESLSNIQEKESKCLLKTFKVFEDKLYCNDKQQLKPNEIDKFNSENSLLFQVNKEPAANLPKLLIHKKGLCYTFQCNQNPNNVQAV